MCPSIIEYFSNTKFSRFSKIWGLWSKSRSIKHLKTMLIYYQERFIPPNLLAYERYRTQSGEETRKRVFAASWALKTGGVLLRLRQCNWAEGTAHLEGDHQRALHNIWFKFVFNDLLLYWTKPFVTVYSLHYRYQRLVVVSANPNPSDPSPSIHSRPRAQVSVLTSDRGSIWRRHDQADT